MYLGRAEAFGLLAALTFLQHFVESYGPIRFASSTIKCYCNNLGIITTLNEMLNSTIKCLNETTKDDQDVYLEITSTAKHCEPLDLQGQGPCLAIMPGLHLAITHAKLL